VTQDHDQPCVELLRRELHAADLRWSDDVAGDADHEQVAEPLVEDELGGHPRVGAAEDDRERLLAGHEVGAPGLAGRLVENPRDEPAVAFHQALERLVSRDHPGILCRDGWAVRSDDVEQQDLGANVRIRLVAGAVPAAHPEGGDLKQSLKQLSPDGVEPGQDQKQ
jgi:hypothetical protein